MESEKYFIVETETRFKVRYLVHATDITPTQALQLIEEGLLQEITQEFVKETVEDISEATPEMLKQWKLPIEEVTDLG